MKSGAFVLLRKEATLQSKIRLDPEQGTRKRAWEASCTVTFSSQLGLGHYSIECSY